PDGRILVAGSFYTINGVAARYIARLNSDGSLDNSFIVGQPNDGISCIALQPDGRILIGGGFTTIGGEAVNRIARLNSSGALDTTFNPGLGPNSTVTSMVLQSDGYLVLGGYFTVYGDTPVVRVARVEAYQPVSGNLPNDFTNDGIAGWIWKGESNGVEGVTRTWQPNWSVATSNCVPPLRTYPPDFDAALAFDIETTGDFDGDGDADWLWRARANGDGRWRIWQIENGGRV